MSAEHPQRLRRLLWRDLGRSLTTTLVACLIAGLFEYLATTVVTVAAWSSAGESFAAATLVRLFCLDMALWTLFWLPLSVVAAGLALTARLALRLYAGDRAFTYPGLFTASPASERGATRTAAWLWALAAGAALYVPSSAAMTVVVSAHFNAPQVEALLLACLQLALIAALAGFAYTIFRLVHALGRKLADRLGRLNPAGRPDAALAVIVLLALVAARVLMARRPVLAPLIPWRHLLTGAALLFGFWAAIRLRESRDGFLPADPRRRLITLFALIFAATVLIPLSLVRIGAEVHTKFVATTNSPALGSLISMVRASNDFDHDGYGSLLGENDCAPFDPEVRPGARDIPDNGIDENCDGRDFSFARMPEVGRGENVPVPEEFRKPWNILLITIDTVRYDHTTFGGYQERSKRNTTPRLAELVDRSVSFDFANAPSAGTMASVPAILTSKFFHSGLALGEERKGMPPLLKPSNVLVSEVLKRAGYTTGAILTHYYFNDWGMEQGFDTYDNELGRENEPYKVTSSDLTDRALQWIARHHGKKWFLWLHYVDPHGRYVEHPGSESYGTSEEDLYDGELRYTDEHVGRLLDELARVPGGERTIVVVTSDHGDGFNEHGFINHGMALYRELLHVPLIFSIPGIQPRRAQGAVTPLDVVPTLAALAGVDTNGLSFEGRSLVPQIFYGRDDLDRIVFAETNWPKPLRAAISQHFKLIYDLKSNVYQLYDLEADAWEKRNVWKAGHAVGKKMKAALDDWLERVYYARDFEANQVTQGQLANVLLARAPTPEHTTSAAFDGGAIELVGYDREAAPIRAGQAIDVIAYFHVTRPPSGDFPAALELWSEDKAVAHGQAVVAGGGVFPTSRWRQGDFVRLELRLQVPANRSGPHKLALHLRGSRTDGGIGPSSTTLAEVAIDGPPMPAKDKRPPRKIRFPRKKKK